MNLDNITYDSKLYLKNGKKKPKARSSVMRIPFGIEKVYGKLILKLEFTNIKTDIKMQVLYDSILKLEEQNMIKLGVSKDVYKSCIIQNKDYDPCIITKIEMKNNRSTCTIINNEEFVLKTIYEFKRNDKVIVDIMFDRLWEYNGKAGCIIKTTKIICV
tara:strand:+ start:1548 stop:2024 length:477 start_codon:yes stop_codon:yes gene_type:complete